MTVFQLRRGEDVDDASNVCGEWRSKRRLVIVFVVFF